MTRIFIILKVSECNLFHLPFSVGQLEINPKFSDKHAKEGLDMNIYPPWMTKIHWYENFFISIISLSKKRL